MTDQQADEETADYPIKMKVGPHAGIALDPTPDHVTKHAQVKLKTLEGGQ